MTRNLKALGLALLALGVLGAMAAQGASANVAHSFTVSQTPAWITGEADPTSGGVQKFTVPGHGPVECKKLHADTTVTESPADELTILPQYEECSFEGLSVKVTNVGTTSPGMTEGGCSYVFDSDTTENPSTKGKEDAPVSIECQAGASIKIEIFSGSTKLCTLNVRGNTVNQNLNGVHYTEVAGEPNDVTLEATVHNINYVVEGALCGLGGLEPGTYNDALYEGNATVKAFEDDGSEATTTQIATGLTTP